MGNYVVHANSGNKQLLWRPLSISVVKLQVFLAFWNIFPPNHAEGKSRKLSTHSAQVPQITLE